MKKIAMSLLCAGLVASSGLQAQTPPAPQGAAPASSGAGASSFAAGSLGQIGIIAGTVLGGLVVAGVANSSGEIVTHNPGPGPGPTPEPECTGSDQLIDGVCYGQSTTTSVTVTGAGTATSTVTFTVPVTVTYLPSVAS